MNEYDSQAKPLLGHDYVTVALIKDHKFINSVWSYLHAVNRVHHTVLHYACQRARSKMNGHSFCWKAFIFWFIHSSKGESYRLQLWKYLWYPQTRPKFTCFVIMRVQWTPAILDSQFCLLRSHVTHFVTNQMSESLGRANQILVLSLGPSNVTKFFWFLFSEAKGEKVDALFRILRGQTKNNCCSCKCLKMALLNEYVFTTGLVDSVIVGSILKTFNFCAEAELLPKLTNVRARFVFFFFCALLSNFICVYHLFKIVLFCLSSHPFITVGLYQHWRQFTLTSVICTLKLSIDFMRDGGVARLICFSGSQRVHSNAKKK